MTRDHLDNDKEELIQKLGNICHETYLGCDNLGNDDWRYSYSTEALIQLETDEASKAIDQYTQSKLKAFAGEFEKAIGEEIMCYDSTDISHKFMSCDTCQSNMKNYELRQALKAIKGKAGIE